LEVRVLKPGGTLFIRMTSDIGIENRVQEIDNGVYHIPDGFIRYLFTMEMLAAIMTFHPLPFVEPFKTVNVMKGVRVRWWCGKGHKLVN
jgi:hypothetical protein